MTGNSNSRTAAAATAHEPSAALEPVPPITPLSRPTSDIPTAPDSGLELRSLKAARREAVDRFEIEYIRALLRKAEGNVTRAAALADVSRQVIHKLIAKHRP